MRAPLLLTLLTACGAAPVDAPTPPEPHDFVLRDLTLPCVGDARIEVVVGPCLRACETVTSASCTATLDGAVLVVEGAAHVRSTCVLGESYPSSCERIVATCDLPAGLDPATTSVRLDTETTTTPLSEIPTCPNRWDTAAPS